MRKIGSGFRVAVALLAALWGGVCTPVSAQDGFHGPAPQRSDVTLAFYNTENFFDTLPGRSQALNEFTPGGPRRWNAERYDRKLTHIARVLDTLKADVVGLAEVEGETVLRDLLESMHSDYNYVWMGGEDARGMGVALLYRGSQFQPLKTYRAGGRELPRKILGVEGELAGERITILVCHLPAVNNPKEQRINAARSLRSVIDRLYEDDPEHRLVVMGDFNFPPGSALARKILQLMPRNSPGDPRSLYTPFAALEHKGFGTYVYRDRRLLYDYIAVNAALAGGNGQCGIFAPDFLFQSAGQRRGYPFRTYNGSVYTGGYSDHLPVWLTLIRQSNG